MWCFPAIQVHGGGYPRCCCEFLGQVVTSLRWPDIVAHYSSHEVADIVQHLHTGLFTLLVQLSTHGTLMEVGSVCVWGRGRLLTYVPAHQGRCILWTFNVKR